MTPNEKELVETRICCSCKKEKPIKSFYKSTAKSIADRCKLCNQQNKKCIDVIEKPVKKGRGNSDGPALFNVSKRDWEKTFLFLKQIGYDLNKDLHLQFCEKYNLEPKKRTYEASVIYSPKDLGLV